MLGSSSTTRTRAPSLLTGPMVPRLSVNLLGNEWELAWRGPSRNPVDSSCLVDQPCREALLLEPADGSRAHDYGGRRSDVSVNAHAGQNRSRSPPPAALRAPSRNH